MLKVKNCSIFNEIMKKLNYLFESFYCVDNHVQ
jgi:hypothetical protein